MDNVDLFIYLFYFLFHHYYSREALKDVHAFFAATNSYDPQTIGRELELGKGLVDVSKEAGIQHFIWSSLPK